MAALAYRLWELKAEAGDPSFAEMSTRMGAAASKSSLAAAARGQVLPTWETTWEFVRVLAVDRLKQDAEEARREWRAHWEQAASAAARSETTEGRTGHDETRAGPAEARTGHDETRAGPAEARAGHIETEVRMAEHPERRTRPPLARRPAMIAAVATAAAATGAALFSWLAPLSGKDEPTAPNTPARAASPYDDSAFERDVTHPDGTKVKTGAEFTKIWRIRNTGTIPWRGRYLTRLNDTPCRAPKRVEIHPVQPGEPVDIAVRVRASDSPGRCKIYWKMTDEAGTQLLSAKKPIFLDVVVG
ncbi:NBR1-Ig-like domain-containing protein [Nonomuraea angiospora]|uniref:NBR1-Ig-like domain-containing protein n=1 Tax=Nonomuraea angiospora TaxID=46172 RepID=UPI0029B2B57F|nr:NBR1-Ig-like domain-containing protein [Nonomuraea angiospora]MDX3100276.1 NBR1-Ig-like domain-containing protein [Nonomuraea angiospora]